MELQKAIETRTSIRKYDASKKVTEEMLKDLVETANLAPTWGNCQTGRYYCIKSEEMLEKFRKECLPTFNANSVQNAPALIITAFVKNHSGFNPDGTQSNEIGNGWGIYDLGLQNQNLLLKAKDMGLDTLVIGIRDESKIRELLSIDENEIIVSVIAFGYAAQEAKRTKRKPVEEIIHLF